MSLPFFREYQHPTTYIILFHQCLSHETHRLLFTTLSPSCQWTSLLALSLKMVRSEWLFLPAHQVPASKTVNNGQLTVDNVSRSTLSTSCFFSVFQNFLANPTGSQILKTFLLPLSTANWIIANCLKWRISDSNRWPPACKAGALASWANPPCNQLTILQFDSWQCRLSYASPTLIGCLLVLVPGRSSVFQWHFPIVNCLLSTAHLFKWACVDSNHGPLHYQCSALTTWATSPVLI